jgi:hypothetical protein
VATLSRISWSADPIGEIAAAMHGVRPVVTVIDTLHALAFLIRAERGNSLSWSPIFATLGQAAADLNSALVYIHHKPRGSDKPRDSTVIEAAVDTLIDVSRAKNDRDLVLKIRSREPVASKVKLAVELGDDGYPTSYAVDEGPLPPDLISDCSDPELQILHVLKQGSFSRRVVQDLVGGNRKQSNDAWMDLKSMGLIDTSSDGWLITDAGEARYQSLLQGEVGL